MKILFLPSHMSTGGMPQFLNKRIKSLQRFADVEIYVVEYQCYSIDFVVQRNQIKNMLGDKFFTLYENKMELKDIVERIQPDIIHIDEMSERLDREMVSWMYNNDRRYRIIETCHDVSFNPADKIFQPDMFLFCTPYHVDTFNPKEYAVIEYPIDDNSQHSWANNSYRKATDFRKKAVLNVGLWTPGKNQAEGIEIAKNTLT